MEMEIFFTLAIIFSMVFGIGAGWMFGEDVTNWSAWVWIRQFWLNFVGSLTGWLCIWIDYGRITAWVTSGYNAQTQLGQWEIFLLIFGFIGITGHLPITTINFITSISNWFKK